MNKTNVSLTKNDENNYIGTNSFDNTNSQNNEMNFNSMSNCLNIVSEDGHDSKKKNENLSYLNNENVLENWLRRCLPIFLQPQKDVENKNHLIKIFYKFKNDHLKNQLNCNICIVYAGEASYDLIHDDRINSCATFLYRSFNRMVYHRTADINYLEYRDVDLDPSSNQPWKSIFTIDYSGEQKWACGERAKILWWFSLMHHYRKNVEYHNWKCEKFRPYIYLNTSNHLMGEKDNNPHFEKIEWNNYSVQEGDGLSALTFAKNHIPTKRNCYSYVCFLGAKNGGGCCDRVKHSQIEHNDDSFYVLHEDDICLSNKK